MVHTSKLLKAVISAAGKSCIKSGKCYCHTSDIEVGPLAGG
jgi:hypothetical protein